MATRALSFMSIMERLTSSGVSVKRAKRPKPATLQSVEMRGFSSSSSFLYSSKLAGSPRSMGRTRAGVRSFFASSSSRSRRRAMSQISSSVSSVSMALANSRPMPEEAPVMTAIFMLMTSVFYIMPRKRR